MVIPPVAQFWIYIISNASSLACSLFVLYHLLSDRTLRRALNNHIIIILLLMGIIYELTVIPWSLHRIRYGKPWFQLPAFYLFSFFFDYGISVSQIVLFAWATIERHILIFHDQWLSTKKKRLFVHYLPIIIILIYCLVYFSIIAFAPICINLFNVFLGNNLFIPCPLVGTTLGVWDIIAHQVFPTIIIIIFSVVLIVRVIWQKRKMNQPIQWRKHRKMTIQLLSVSVLYLIINTPWTTIVLALQYGISKSSVGLPLMYIVYFRVYVIFLFPFVCCGALSELRSKFKRLLRLKRGNQIVAQRTLEMEEIKTKRSVKINTVDH